MSIVKSYITFLFKVFFRRYFNKYLTEILENDLGLFFNHACKVSEVCMRGFLFNLIHKAEIDTHTYTHSNDAISSSKQAARGDNKTSTIVGSSPI